MQYCYINEDNFQYFKPLLQEDQLIRVMSDPAIFGLGCYDKDTACGILLYTVNEELMSFRIIYVAVSLSYQGQGVATGMIKSLARNAYEEGFITLSNFYAKGVDDPRYGMFENTEEFSIEELPGGVYVIDYDGVKSAVYDIPLSEQEKSTSGTRTTISNCSDQTKKSIYNLLRASGMEASEMMQSVDEDLSYAVISEDGAPTAIVLISHFPEHHLYEISYVLPDEPDQVADLFNILTFAITDIFDRMDPRDNLRFSASVASMDKLAGKYFSNDFKAERFYLAGYNGDTVG